ncbi:transporter [Kaistia sp. 32K]|uniref:DMT family transporter n=1 Tax=Kaistia sp. 32K TaxID=2795690 RepID=UPI0019155EBA|nr:DMT family transporter [Kaistia sp. 32K]BCP54379.1 transporter [Kaistia sp. 32K]
MSSDPVLKGLLLGFAAFAAYAFSDASVKFLGGLPPYEIAFIGSLFGLLAVPFLKKPDDRWIDIVRTTNRPLWLVRFAANGAATIGSVIAFSHLSMAEAFALIFLLPAFVTIMSVVFLKEPVGLKRWSAVIIGFVGVLIVLRPGFRELSIGHLGAVVGGLGGAISIVVFRAIGPREKNISLYGAGVLGTFFLCGVLMIPSYAPPGLAQIGWLAGYGILCALGNVLLMLAAFRAPAALVGPTQYSQMLWAIGIDYFVFNIHLELPMLLGIVLIIGSGILTLWREKARGTKLPPSVAAEGQAGLVEAATAPPRHAAHYAPSVVPAE